MQNYLNDSKCKIKLHFLPTYSPNLNIIERLWKIMRKYAIGNKDYHKLDDFRQGIFDFLDNF